MNSCTHERITVLGNVTCDIGSRRYTWPQHVMQLDGIMLKMLDLPSQGRWFNSQSVAIKWLVFKWVTVCGQVNHLGI